MQTAAPAVQVEGLTVWYEGEEQPALSGIDLAVAPGERILLLGPSGCGKSTLVLALNGIIPRAIGGRVEGRVLVGGRPVGDLPPGELCRRVGVLFQDPESQFCMLTAEDEVAFGLENLALPPAEMPARIRAALAAVGLDRGAATRSDRLSGGMKQRLGLACLLAMGPGVLVLDEPTAHLDPVGTRSVFGLLRELVADRRRTLIIIEHKLDGCIDLVDRVVVLDPVGDVAADGPPGVIFDRHADRLVRLGIWQPGVSRLAHQLREAGIWLQPHPLTVAEAVAGLTAAGAGPEVVLRAVAVPAAPPLTAPPPALEIRGLAFAYGGEEVLAGVDLTVPAGHLLAVVGPNGAGKTTLLQLAAGLRRPPSGTVRLSGRDIRSLAPAALAATVGYVFQNPEHQFVRQTVFDEVALGLQRQGHPPAAVRARAEEILAEFGLLERMWANPFSLSQGQKRRLSVATQLVGGQQLLMLDEPTFGQDQATAGALMDRIVGIQRSGRTVAMVTHDMELVATRATMVAVLLGGRIRYAGPPAGLVGEPGLLAAAALELPPAWAVAEALRKEVSPCCTVPATRSLPPCIGSIPAPN